MVDASPLNTQPAQDALLSKNGVVRTDEDEDAVLKAQVVEEF